MIFCHYKPHINYQLSIINYQFHAQVFARKNLSVEPKVSEAKSIIDSTPNFCVEIKNIINQSELYCQPFHAKVARNFCVNRRSAKLNTICAFCKYL